MHLRSVLSSYEHQEETSSGLDWVLVAWFVLSGIRWCGIESDGVGDSTSLSVMMLVYVWLDQARLQGISYVVACNLQFLGAHDFLGPGNMMSERRRCGCKLRTEIPGFNNP